MIPAMQRDLPKSQAGGVCVPREEAFQKGLAALHADRRNVALLNIAATFGILAGTIYVLGRYPGPWSYALAFVGIGLMQYRIVMACHEAVHKTLLFPLWLNESVGGLHCALVGINLLKYRRQHLEHHAARVLEEDTDAYIYQPILQASAGVRRVLSWIFGTAAELVQKVSQKGLTVGSTFAPEGKIRLHSLAILAAQGMLLAACALWLSWWYYFLFWLLPLVTIATFMNRTRVLVEHGYPHVPRPEGSALSGAPVVTVDFSANLLEQFFVAPFRFNYHFAHHRVPSIPYYRNSDLSRLLEQHGEVAPNVARPSYARGLRHVLWT